MLFPPGIPLFQRMRPVGAALSLMLVSAPVQAARTAYYTFESIDIPGLDIAGGDDNATLDGGIPITTGALAGNGAWLLDGKSPGFTIPAGQATVDAAFGATENFTLSAWCRVDKATGRQRIFATYPGWGFGVDFTIGSPRILMTAYGIEDKFIDAPDIVTGKWFHVAAVITPADESGTVYTQIYFNGVPLGSPDDGNYNTAPNNVLIGSAGGGFEGFNGALDELCYFDNALTEAEALALYKAGAVDTDGDGMLDTWESSYGLKPNDASDATGDLDGDGLNNKAEYDLGMLPNNRDTDGDGLDDGVEDGGGVYESASKTGTDPKNPDSDGDTILDGAEMAVTATDPYATDPNNRDTDGDLLPDNYEVYVSKTDPTKASDPAPVPNLIAEYRFELPEFPGLDSSGGDDSATLLSGSQVKTGALSGTGAYSMDGANAGMRITPGFDPDPDFSATENFSISVWFRLSAATGRQRILTGNAWGLGLDFGAAQPRVLMTTFGVEDKFFAAPDVIAGKWFHLAAIITPADENGVVWTKIYLNGVLIGQDDGPYTGNTSLTIGATGEGWNGLIDELRFYDIAIPETKIQELYAVGNSDEDHDGMPASWELTYGLNPNDPADAAQDLDGDGLTNKAEYDMGLLPNNKDTDGDGIEDGAEDGGGVYVSATKTGTDPHKADTDGDGIPDGAEKATSAEDPYATDPNKADTDGDAYPDGYEVNTLHSDPTNPADPNRPRGLIAHYDFENPDALGTDSAGGDDNATPTSGVYQTTGAEAKIGEGAIFLSGTDLLRIGAGNLLADIDFRATSGFSAATWFNFSEATGRQRILSGWPGWGMGVNFTDGPAGVLITAFGVIDAYFPVTLSAGHWYHLAFTVSDVTGDEVPTVTVYLDGAVLGTNAFKFNPATNFAIGSFSADGPFESFAGYVDDVRYYNKSLSGSEVTDLYAMGGGVVDSSFQITAFSRTNGLATLTFTSVAGGSYTIQRSTALSGWQSAGTVTAAGATTTWSETTAPAASDRYFYRVQKN